jgi:nucleoside-diphosphate-sugar epimerase
MSGRLVITGATGFLGGALARHFAAEGYRVVALGRDARTCEDLRAEGFETHAIDLADPAVDLSPPLDSGCDALIHCAALSAPWGPRRAFAAANIAATRHLLEAAARFGCGHFIFVSSPSVYFRPCDQFQLKERGSLPQPVNSYAWSKRAAEVLCERERRYPVTIVRPRAIYGRGDRALLPRLRAACLRGPLPLVNEGRAVTDPTHIDDVTAAIAAVLAAPAPRLPRLFNISGGVPISIRQLVEASTQRSGVTVRWRRVSWPVLRGAVAALEATHLLLRRPGEPTLTRYGAGIFAFSQTLDLSDIAAAIGWRPRISFEEGLRRTFA